MSGCWAQQAKSGSHAEMATCQNAVEVHDSQHQNSSIVLAAADDPSSVPHCVAPHYPAHFTKGSVIQLANGDLKRIEDLSTDDFVRSADMSKDLCIDTSVVRGITPVADRATVMLQFSVESQESQVQIEVESTVEHPFFVYNRGWSSCSPDRTLQRYRLHCHQLLLNDKCISLTQRSSSTVIPTSFMNGPLVTTNDWHPPATQLMPVSSLARTRLSSNSAVLSRQLHDTKS